MEEKKYLELKTPDLGDTEKIELVKWYANSGDSIEEGQEVLELVTDKAAFTVESPKKGVLVEKRLPNGALVHKNEILGILELV